jgi:hypothetical protein
MPILTREKRGTIYDPRPWIYIRFDEKHRLFLMTKNCENYLGRYRDEPLLTFYSVGEPIPGERVF